MKWMVSDPEHLGGKTTHRGYADLHRVFAGDFGVRYNDPGDREGVPEPYQGSH